MNLIIWRLLFCMLMLSGLAVASAQPYCDVRTFSVRDGLSANIISSITQSSDGMMWFSTYNGLCCYDGYQFTTFRKGTTDTQLSTNRIAMIKADSKTGLWLITYDRGLYLFDLRSCCYVDMGSEVNRKASHMFVPRNIYPLSNGYTWINGNNGECIRVNDNCPTQSENLQIVSCKELPVLKEYVKKVVADSNGREWVFTDGGIVLYGTKVCQEGHFEHLAEESGRVYLATTDGELYTYIPNHKQLQKVSASVPLASTINHLCPTSKELLLISTDRGLSVLNTHTGVIKNLHPGLGAVSHAFVDYRQRIWVFAQNGDMFLAQQEQDESFSIRRLQLLPSLRMPFSPTLSEKTLWVEDANQTIWLATEGGTFCYYDETEGQLRPYSLQSGGQDYLYRNIIKKCFIDRQHNLWFTSSHDLTLVNLKHHSMKALPFVHGHETRSLLSLPDGTTWAGTIDGYIVAFSADGHQMGYMGRDGRLTTKPVTFDSRIYALYRDRQNRIWIGTRDNGLFVIHDGHTTHYTHDGNNSFSLSSNMVYAFDEDEQGHLWIGTFERGLNLAETLPDGSVRFLHSGNLLKTYPIDTYAKVRRITHDGKGTIIVSTTTGLLTMSSLFTDPAKIKYYASCHIAGDTTSIRTNDVMQALVTRKGSIYVTTMGGCIQRIESKNLLQDGLRFSTPQNQHDGNVMSLIEDQNGRVWVVREAIVDLIEPDNGLLAEYGPNDFGEQVEFTEAQPSLSVKDSTIWLPTMRGVIALQPAKMKRNSYRPDIVFTSVQFQGEATPHPVLSQEVLDVPSDKRSLTISFAALDYQNNYLVRYAYKLDGIDHEWTYVGKEHQAQLSHLPAGRHRLLVRSTNSDGVWTDNETALVVEVEPTFWETIWAKMLYALMAVIVIGTGVHIYNLRRKAAIQREMDELKTRFYTDVSHQLRTPLTLIGGPVIEVLSEGTLSERARQLLEMVQRNARQMLELVNKMLEKSTSKNFYVDDANAPVFAGNDSFTDAVDETGHHPDIRLLIVEDNDDLRQFLVSILQAHYTVMEAPNGRIGLEKAQQEQPDFIITDVTMPEMDGLTMVHQIKQNPDISHIPIVVLSAKASLDDRLQGLKEGIDDYITKPFSATYLRQRIENIISQRRMLQQTLLGRIEEQHNYEGEKDGMQKEFRLETPQIVDADQKMMEQLMDFLQENIGNQDLKIEDMADAVCLGRTVFYGKIKTIVGMAPVDFLRHIRMQRAEDLISRSQMNVSEVAYAVGFSDPKYFTKCFKKDTGMTPTEYRDKNGRAVS